MQKKENISWKWFAAIFTLAALITSARANSPFAWAVQPSATVTTSPARVTLSFPGDGNATSYTVSRKAANSSSWTQVGTLGGGASVNSFVDNNVAVGSSYEYQ